MILTTTRRALPRALRLLLRMPVRIRIAHQ
jgi:hypothetical protein